MFFKHLALSFCILVIKVIIFFGFKVKLLFQGPFEVLVFKKNTTSFEDKSLNIGNEYRYKLKITFDSGEEKYHDKILTIDF